MAKIRIYLWTHSILGHTLLRYKSSKGLISLALPCCYTMNLYEIYCLEGELFENIERFDTLKETEARIRELLK